MSSLARIRASQLQQCLATESVPTEAIIQATLALIAVSQGPADPLALAVKVSMVSQIPDVQLNATVPAQDSSSSINTTARAEVTGDSLYTIIAHNSNTSPTGCRPNHVGHNQHHANSFRMSANDVPEQLVLRGTSDEDVPAILAQFRERVELKGDVLQMYPRSCLLLLLLKSVGDATRQRAGNHCLTGRSAHTAQAATTGSLRIRAPGYPGSTTQ